MHAVVETPAYLRDAADAGIPDVERGAIKRFLGENPKAGDLMEGTGGARKVHFAGRGKGKSGGYRVITYFGGDDIPVEGRAGKLVEGGKERIEEGTGWSCSGV